MEKKIVKSIFKGGTIVFLGLVISKIFGLLYRVVVGRTLGPEEYGIISVMMAVSSVIGVLAFIGIPNGVQKYVAEYRGTNDIEKQAGIVRTGLLLVTIPSVIVMLIVFILAPWIATELFNEPRAIWPIRFVALILPLRAYRKVFYRTTDAYEKMQYKIYANQLYANISKVILTLVFIGLGFNYIGAAIAYAFAWGSAVVLSGYFAYKVFPEAFKVSLKTEKEYSKLFQHSWPLFAAGILASVAGYIDTFMLQAFLGSEEVGLYNSAYPLAAVLTFSGSALGSIYLSNASKLFGEGKKDELAEAYRLVTKWIGYISLPLFSVIILFPQALLQLFGPDYLGMANVLRVLALGFLLSALIGPTSKIIQAVDKTKYKLYLTLFIGTTNILLNYLLIPVYGIIGAAYATALTFGFGFILKTIIVTYLSGKTPFRPVLIKIMLSSLAAAAPIFLLSYLTSYKNSLLYLVIIMPLYGLIYLYLLLFTRTIQIEDLVVLKYIKRVTGIESEKLEAIVKKYAN